MYVQKLLIHSTCIQTHTLLIPLKKKKNTSCDGRCVEHINKANVQHKKYPVRYGLVKLWLDMGVHFMQVL